IIDTGSALRLISRLKNLGSVTAVLGGTMGRVALIDAGLEDILKISPRRSPSQSVRDLEASNDLIFLLSHAKTAESGLAFGSLVARAAGTEKPLIQIDCGGGFVSILRGDEDEAALNLAICLASDLGLDLIDPLQIQNILIEGDLVRRSLSGVLPGELVSVNGTVIGRAVDSQVELAAKNGRIVDLVGVSPKQHGLDKLGYIDLEIAVIRSGSIRRTTARSKSFAVKCEHEREMDAVFIDHCAEDAFERARGAGIAVTVGDDTTAITGDIMARLGVLVMGIVDGDIDRLAGCTIMMPGSMVFHVEPGNDDLIGTQVKAQIFKGRESIRVDASELACRIREIAGERLIACEEIRP
ncbi:MAG: DUF2117 domain-containing protein, partial [Methanothrix sp.]|nr:DUF2117 domain-containing protein [Methanothrix sp.]